MATHSSILAWRIPGTGDPGGLPSMGSHRVGHHWRDLAAVSRSEWVHGNPHEYPCLENPMDRGAWQAAVHGVAQSRTRLKQLSTQHSCTDTHSGWYLELWKSVKVLYETMTTSNRRISDHRGFTRVILQQEVILLYRKSFCFATEPG